MLELAAFSTPEGTLHPSAQPEPWQDGTATLAGATTSTGEQPPSCLDDLFFVEGELLHVPSTVVASQEASASEAMAYRLETKAASAAPTPLAGLTSGVAGQACRTRGA